ncbi:chemotaxis protein CheW [Desulfonatronum thioautotrophicum]|uniref:chemotaxis protein CheW n=1 Tax=Desulfonatronum thioautotrophicum TaxID=617001 RepID=UPI0005EB119E|nr:chemotaxis protein CheW [Desulfonatronum thioautotrophicum]
MKTLEQYFQDQPLLSEDTGPGTSPDNLTSAEEAFLKKYLGVGDKAEAHAVQIQSVSPEQVMAGPTTADAAASGSVPGPDTSATSGGPLAAVDSIPQKSLREQSELQLIGFRLANQDYALPIDVVQEVIRAVEPTKLPSAPAFLSGVVNLRGRVTPLVSLRMLLRLPPGEDRFIIVCRHGGLQVGLQIQTVSTMHRVKQDRIDWAVESLLGVQSEMISGLIRAENQKLITILSLDQLIQSLVTS